MQRPPAMLCLPVDVRRCRDGDTIEVSLHGSGLVWAIRLADCSCPELSTDDGREAKHMAEATLEQCGQVYVEIDLVAVGANPLAKLVTFDRILGKLWVAEDRTLGDVLVEAGMGRRPVGPASNRH